MVNARAPLVCIGHSHIEAVVAAAAKAGVPLEIFDFWHPSFRVEGVADAVQIVNELRSRALTPIFSFVGGGPPMDFGMIVHPRPYDFVLPERPDLPFADGAELVPYDALHASMQAHARPYLEIMGTLRGATDGPMFHLEAPPPRQTELVSTDDLGWIAFFGKDSVISPAWLRYKLWWLHSKIISSYCTETDIKFVPYPREATDESGFLAPRFCGNPGHANQDYGALVLKQMHDLLTMSVSGVCSNV